MKEILKSCPFCGSFNIAVYEDNEKSGKYTYAFCNSCFSRGPAAWKVADDESAYEYTVNLWNERVESQRVQLARK